MRNLKQFCLLLALILVLSACGNSGRNEKEPEPVEPVAEQPADAVPVEIIGEWEPEYTTYYSGSYRNDWLAVEYDPAVFSLIERRFSEEDSDFALVPAGGDLLSFPRIDVFRIDISALTPNTISELGESGAAEDFEGFCRYLLYDLYPEINDEITGLVLDVPETICVASDLRVTESEKYGHVIFLVKAADARLMPESIVEFEMIGNGESGVMKRMLYSAAADEETKTLLSDQMQNIKFLSA